MNYIEEFVDSLSELPIDVKRELNLCGVLDAKAVSIFKLRGIWELQWENKPKRQRCITFRRKNKIIGGIF